MEPVLKSTQRNAHRKFGKKPQKVAALASASVLLLLAGCTSTTAAVTVGKNSTSVARVQETVTNILNARKGVDTTGMNLLTGSALASSQAQFFLISQLLADEGKSIGITVTPAEATAEKNAAIKQVGGEAALPKALVGANIDAKNLDLYFTSVLYSQRLIAAIEKSGMSAANAPAALTLAISEMAKKEGIQVNPRYGKWDSKTATLVAADTTSGAVTTK
jgi:hypothetical protein